MEWWIDCSLYCKGGWDGVGMVVGMVVGMTTMFTLKKVIAKFIISIYAIPVFHADDPVPCFTRN